MASIGLLLHILTRPETKEQVGKEHGDGVAADIKKCCGLSY